MSSPSVVTGDARVVPTSAWPLRTLLGVPLAALLFTLATPPHDWAIAGWIAPGVLLASVRRHRPAAAAAIGAAFGLLAAWGVTGWVPAAALRYFEADRLRATTVGLALWVWSGGLSFALLAAAYAWTARRTSPHWRALVAAWLWIAVEWLRSTAGTGLPWALLAHGQFRHPRLLQVAALGGAYALSFVMTACSVGAIEALVTRGPWRRRVRLVALPALLGAATVAYGAFPNAPDTAAARDVLLVQSNLRNQFHWSRADVQTALATQLRLTAAASAERSPDLIVWPENAVDVYLDREPQLLLSLRRVAAGAREGFVLGAPRLVSDAEARNAAYLLAPSGWIAGVWDKHHPVPFAEYRPWATGDGQDAAYRPGSGGGPLDAGQLRLGVFICYEALFAPLVRDLVRDGATVLVSPSNDAWLDGDGADDAGPQQLFAAAVFRAVETRRYLVRAATTGVSAVVAPDGRIVEALPTGVAGTLHASVYARSDRTPYVRIGDAWIAVAGAALSFVARRRRPPEIA